MLRRNERRPSPNWPNRRVGSVLPALRGKGSEVGHELELPSQLPWLLFIEGLAIPLPLLQAANFSKGIGRSLPGGQLGRRATVAGVKR